MFFVGPLSFFRSIFIHSFIHSSFQCSFIFLSFFLPFFFFFFDVWYSCITHRSKARLSADDEYMVNEHPHYREILDVLKHDKRFLVLDCHPDLRQDMILAHIDELAVERQQKQKKKKKKGK